MTATTRPLRSSVLALVGMAATTGCQPDPIAADLDAWYYGMSAVLVENAALAHDIQEFAADITKARKAGKVSAKKTAKNIGKSIVPTAQQVAAHAADVRPTTPEYQALHDELAAVWTERAEAYEGILTAWDDADSDALATGMQQVRDLRISEAVWFPRANAVIEPKGYRFEEFPQSVPTPPAD